jgi:Co/Zn/Cd efflux system component
MRSGRPFASDAALANLAGACLGSSVVALIGLLFLVLMAASPRLWVRENPIAVAAILLGAVAFLISAFALTRLRRPHPSNPRRLWLVSLSATILLLGVLVSAIGVKLAILFGLPQIVAIVPHVLGLTRIGTVAHDS